MRERQHNISKLQSAGATESEGDAVTLIPLRTLELIERSMDDPNCTGGAVDVYHKPAELFMRCYSGVWRIIRDLSKMAQGATQFCRRSEFQKLGG